nr:hypothetical protein CFP56_00749 [Quercus suber]
MVWHAWHRWAVEAGWRKRAVRLVSGCLAPADGGGCGVMEQTSVCQGRSKKGRHETASAASGLAPGHISALLGLSTVTTDPIGAMTTAEVRTTPYLEAAYIASSFPAVVASGPFRPMSS